jgi:RNA recognition motif-containing protein
MSTKLYVGNLSYNTADEQLRAAFASCGTVATASVIVDRATGQSRGFGFVEFDSDADAQSAIQTMDGSELDGRRLQVNQARERRDGGGRHGR